VDLYLGSPVVGVDRNARTVVTAHDVAISYDALVLATGSRPFVPPVSGRERLNCFVYRTFDDLDALRAAAHPGRPGVVIGGGLLGLEVANALATDLGLHLHCGTAVASVDGDTQGAVRAVTLTDGTVVDATLVVFAMGIRPRDELAAGLGLDRGERGGILVDEYCRTADPRVWAIGECAAVHGRTYGLVAPGYRMADSVALQLVGRPGR
jgi:nitrite reductase (NADH) large subunit